MSEQEIRTEIVSRIVAQFQPNKIILFGSRARNEAQTRSDYDLLILMPFEENRRVLMGKIDRALWGLGIGRDIIVLTPDEYEMNKTIIGTIARVASNEGVLLYDAA